METFLLCDYNKTEKMYFLSPIYIAESSTVRKRIGEDQIILRFMRVAFVETISVLYKP